VISMGVRFLASAKKILKAGMERIKVFLRKEDIKIAAGDC